VRLKKIGQQILPLILGIKSQHKVEYINIAISDSGEETHDRCT
jgi:hypothetical protein